MDDSAFSDEFCRFIQNTIPAVDAAELLLVLAAAPDAWWSPAEAFAKLGTGASMTEAEGQRYLERFRAAGLLAIGSDKRVQYQPASERLAALVQTLSQAYKERPVTLIRLIYAMRDTKVRSFADAFKLRS